MEANILLSKIVANPTETTWSQVYSTLNLYVVLSIRVEESDKGIVAGGKELLEKIQREYFSLDDKNLKNIKEAVEKAVVDVPNKKGISVVLATIADNVLYLVIASSGSVFLKRGGKVAEIARGEEDQVIAFSGQLSGDDMVFLETGDFTQKIPVEKLQSVVDHLEVSEISENLAPLVHEHAQGTEAAIILQYKNVTSAAPPLAEEKEEAETPTKEEEQSEAAHEEPMNLDDDTPKRSLSKIHLPKLSSLGGKKIIPIIILILVIIFVGSIFMERGRQETAARQSQLNAILTPAEKKFNEANALVALNRGLALDEFNSLKGSLDGEVEKIKEGTPERKKLDEFIGKVESKIGELGAGSTLSNQELVYDKNAKISTFYEDQLAVVKDNGDVELIDSNGKVTKTIETKNENAVAAAQDEASVYVLGDLGVTKSDKQSGKTTTTVEDISDAVSLGTFGANLYGLNTDTKTVDKYTGGTSPGSDYFKEDITLNNPVSMSIDGSVWIIDDGKIRRFTKGAEDSFNVSGITRDISNESQIFTGVDYSDIYILDKDSTRILAISKDGELKNQYVSRELGNASSFSVDESGKKIYVVISGKLYSFDL